MNFELTDDQRSIQRTARDFLASSYPPAEVRRLAYLAHPAPERS